MSHRQEVRRFESKQLLIVKLISLEAVEGGAPSPDGGQVRVHAGLQRQTAAFSAARFPAVGLMRGFLSSSSLQVSLPDCLDVWVWPAGSLLLIGPLTTSCLVAQCSSCEVCPFTFYTLNNPHLVSFSFAPLPAVLFWGKSH